MPPPKRPPLLPMKSGTELACGTVIQKYLGRSEGGLSYLGKHPSFGQVVVKDLANELIETFQNIRDEIEGFIDLQHPSLQKLISFGDRQGHPYLIYTYVQGQNLDRVLESITQNGPPEFRTVYDLLGHMTTAIETLHEVSPHGVLTSSNIYIDNEGNVIILNAGFARVMLCALGSKSDAFRDSVYLAPEVREDPWSASETSDIYSLGVLAVSLLSGTSPSPTTIDIIQENLCDQYPPQVCSFLKKALEKDPAMRLASVVEFREELMRALTAVKKEVRIPKPGELHFGEEKPKRPKRTTSILDGIELPPPLAFEDSDERWVINRNGRDYGPFSDQQIKDKLTSDDINEKTKILDTYTQDFQSLIDVETFTDFVLEYIPKREKRKLEEKEKREETVRQVKRKGSTTILTAVLGVVALFGVFAYFLRVEPLPYPYESITRSFRSVFEVVEPEYAEISTDNDLIASLFNFDEPAEPERSSRRSRRRSSSSSSDGNNEDGEAYEAVEDDYVLDFNSNLPTRTLSQDEINSTLRSEAYRLQRCFESEMRVNPRFRGAELTWSIHPDGRVFNVRAEGNMSDSTETCLTRQFRRIRFPAFNNLPMNVSYPFYVQ